MSIMKMYQKLEVTLTAVKAQGTKIHTKEFGELVDMESGSWAVGLGHCRKDIAEVISENARLLFHTNQFFDTEHPAALAEELTQAAGLPCNYRGTFMSSGTEAVSLAVKLSELLTKREKKLCLTISYLGSSPDLHMPRNPKEWLDINVSDCLLCTKNCTCGECGKFKDIPFHEMASFVFEPGNSCGLVLCPPDKLITYLAENTKNSGGLVVVNEVTTGFGRTGKWLSHQWHLNSF